MSVLKATTANGQKEKKMLKQKSQLLLLNKGTEIPFLGNGAHLKEQL